MRERLAAAIYGLLALGSLSLGTAYLARQEFMPYHATARGQNWNALSAREQSLLLALMRVVGGGFVALSLSLGLLLALPFRRGQPWARWVLPALCIAVFGPALAGTRHVARNSPARAPFYASAAALGLTLLALWLAPPFAPKRDSAVR